MGKLNRKQKKRIDKLAQDVLNSEIERNNRVISRNIDDSAIFEDTNETKKIKKTKIYIHARPEVERSPKKPKQEFFDIWGDEPILPKKDAKKISVGNISYPRTDESYQSTNNTILRSELLMKQKIEKMEEKALENLPKTKPSSTGMGDTLAGDINDNYVEPFSLPEPKKKKRCDLILSRHIPRNMPLNERIRIRRMIRENNKIKRERDNAEIEKNYDRMDEIIKEVDAELNKPVKEKEHRHRWDSFIADEPVYVTDVTKPESLSDVSGDVNSMARYRRSLELRDKLGVIGEFSSYV